MSAQNVLDGLHALQLDTALMDYVKNERDHRSLFGYKAEKYTPQETAYQLQLSKVLNADGMHSGGSYSSVLFNIQAVLKGTMTREVFEVEAQKDKEWYAANR